MRRLQVCLLGRSIVSDTKLLLRESRLNRDLLCLPLPLQQQDHCGDMLPLSKRFTAAGSCLPGDARSLMLTPSERWQVLQASRISEA